MTKMTANFWFGVTAAVSPAVQVALEAQGQAPSPWNKLDKAGVESLFREEGQGVWYFLNGEDMGEERKWRWMGPGYYVT